MYPSVQDYTFIENRARQLRAEATRSFFARLFAKSETVNVKAQTA